MKKAKEKKLIAPNEASLGRWIAVLLACAVFGLVLAIVFIPMLKLPEDTFMGISHEQILTILVWVPLFWGFVIALKLVGKTSLKDFVLGVGGKVNRKESLTILGLYLVGLMLVFLPNLGNIHLRGIKPGEFGFLVLFMLLTLWCQTTFEELVFRGLLIRWACKNQVGFTRKAVIVAVITALTFGLAHTANSPVTSKSGIQMVLAVSAYCFSGLMYFVADLYFGSLLPGILVHWTNNFVVFTLIGDPILSIESFPTLLVDTTSESGADMLLSKILMWLPIIIYIIWDSRKKKKAIA